MIEAKNETLGTNVIDIDRFQNFNRLLNSKNTVEEKRTFLLSHIEYIKENYEIKSDHHKQLLNLIQMVLKENSDVELEEILNNDTITNLDDFNNEIINQYLIDEFNLNTPNFNSTNELCQSIFSLCENKPCFLSRDEFIQVLKTLTNFDENFNKIGRQRQHDRIQFLNGTLEFLKTTVFTLVKDIPEFKNFLLEKSDEIETISSNLLSDDLLDIKSVQNINRSISEIILTLIGLFNNIGFNYFDIIKSKNSFGDLKMQQIQPVVVDEKPLRETSYYNQLTLMEKLVDGVSLKREEDRNKAFTKVKDLCIYFIKQFDSGILVGIKLVENGNKQKEFSGLFNEILKKISVSENNENSDADRDMLITSMGEICCNFLNLLDSVYGFTPENRRTMFSEFSMGKIEDPFVSSVTQKVNSNEGGFFGGFTRLFRRAA